MLLLICMLFFYLVFLCAEIVNIKRQSLSPLLVLRDKYVALGLLSAAAFLSAHLVKVYLPAKSLPLLTAHWALGILCSFLLSAYMLFRGLSVLFKVSGKQDRLPKAITKLQQRPLRTLLCLFLLVLLASAAGIYALWMMSKLV